MKLSKRLETIASFVAEGSSIADIGTDHGYIPICLVERGIAPRALAMDVRQGPLDRARAHVEEAGYSDQITTRLSDGLAAMKPGEADTVIIAGMGGELILHILEEGRALWPGIRQFVLSPHSETGKVRAYLRREGFRIRREAMVKDEGKYYPVMDVTPDGRKQQEGRLIDDLYGAFLLEARDPVLREYLAAERRKAEELLRSLEQADTEGARQRVRSLREEIGLLKEAEYEMQ